VTAVNDRARTDRVLAGHVSPDGVGLHDGTVAGQGETIVTRRNDRRLSTGKGWVKNGDEWTVLHAHADGRLTVRRQGARGRRGRVTLPAGYVAEHTPGFQAGHLTARSILCGVLQHEGAERSAHETITTEQDAWTSIAQLAAEYETIAQVAQHDRYAATVYSSGPDAEHAQAITSAESFGSLVAQLRRIEADGREPDRSLARVLRAGGLNGAEDPAAVLQARLAKLTATRAGGTRPRQRPRYLAGRIAQATGPMPTDMRRTLSELGDLIEQRADALTEHAIQNNQPWIANLGPTPSDPARRAAWQQQIRTVAAYRDRYRLNRTHPLGQPPTSHGQRLDHQRATLAARQAQTAATQSVARQHTRDQQIDTGRHLGR
jgi:hypothetical protein